MDTENKLRIGDASDNGQVTIVDEDRLCYLVKSDNRGAVGLRTISKALLNEYIHYFDEHPDSNANNARDVLCGKTEIDKFEYGYTSTLTMMAKMVLDYDKVLHVSTGNADIIKNNEHMYQQIFYGAPGTGKSHCIKNNAKVKKAEKNDRVFRTTFHPDSDYSTFVGCYKPTSSKSDIRGKQPILDYDSLVDKFKEYLNVPNVNITKACTLFGFDYQASHACVYCVADDVGGGCLCGFSCRAVG